MQLFSRGFLLLLLLTVFACDRASAQAVPGEHSFPYVQMRYEQACADTVLQALSKYKPCYMEIKIQIDPNGRVLATNIEQTTCLASQQKKLTKDISKIIFPRFPDEFLHHSRGKIPVLQLSFHPPDGQPGEITRIKCLWGEQ